MKFSSILLSGLLALSAAACRDRNAGGNGGDGPDGGAGGDTIFDLQGDDMAVGTQVTLRGVVVVTVNTYGGRSGGIYVMEPEGGPFSGVFVFLKNDSAADLRPGDLVNVEGGVKDEFALSDDESGRTLTELSPPDGGDITVTKVGTGTVPDPEVLLPQDLAADDEEAEKWEGVLIKFEDVRLLNAPRSATQSDDTLYEFRITGPFIIQSSLAPFPEDMVRDDCTTSITGLGDYFFDYKILPRKTDDIVVGGDDCLPVENSDALCADGDDNDYNGFADCDDLSCLGAMVACPSTSATVVNIQSGVIADDTRVRLNDVVVTAIDREGTDEVFVQDAGAPGPNKGVVIRMPNSTTEVPTDLVVGSRVDIDATTQEFGSNEANLKRTQLTQPTFSGITVGAAPSPLLGTAVSLLADPGAPGEPFASAFVKVVNIEVVSDTLMNGKVSTTDGTTELILDDNFFPTTTGNKLSDQVAPGDCLTVTGMMDFLNNDNQRILLPRAGADIVKLASSACD